MKKHIISVIILCLLPISAVLLTLCCLETYDLVVHNDAGFFVCCYSVIAFVASTVLFFCMKNKKPYCIVIWILSTLLLAFVFYIGTKIPFCVVCDKVTAEDLGFLIHWIKPEQ